MKTARWISIGCAACCAMVSVSTSTARADHLSNDVPNEVQTILTIKLELGTSPLWHDFKSITANIPLKVLTTNGRMIALQVGDEPETDFMFVQKDGTQIRNPMDPAIVPISTLETSAYKVYAK